MSEKRFTVISEKIGRFHNISVQTDKIEYLLTGGFDNDSEMIKEIVDLLNELQATIDKQNKIIKEQTLRVYCQDQEIQKLINQLEKIPDSIKDVWLKD